MKGKSGRIIYLFLMGGLAVLFVVLIALDLYYVGDAEAKNPTYKTYRRHYAFISNSDYSGEIWDNIFRGAHSCGEESDVYVEWFGKNLVQSYSKQELMELAIAADVDGIIVEGDDSSEMNTLINEATENGIPVVTVLKDCYGSYRNSFVGMSSYNLGQEYGNLLTLMRAPEEKQFLVVINTGANDSSEKLIYAGIKETISGITNEGIEVETMIVDASSAYGIEESLRNYMLDVSELPDMTVCLDEQTTEIMAQLTVDYNRVGQTRLIGFYDSEAILQYIQSGVTAATITADAANMGRTAVTALEEYHESGYVSDYIPAELLVISSENVSDYIENRRDTQE